MLYLELQFVMMPIVHVPRCCVLYMHVYSGAVVFQCDITDHMPVTTVTATDMVDTGSFADVVYSEVAGDVGRFDLNTATGQVRIAPGLNWDYETEPNVFVLEVRATDNPSGTPQLTVSYAVHTVIQA